MSSRSSSARLEASRSFGSSPLSRGCAGGAACAGGWPAGPSRSAGRAAGCGDRRRVSDGAGAGAAGRRRRARPQLRGDRLPGLGGRDPRPGAARHPAEEIGLFRRRRGWRRGRQACLPPSLARMSGCGAAGIRCTGGGRPRRASPPGPSRLRPRPAAAGGGGHRRLRHRGCGAGHGRLRLGRRPPRRRRRSHRPGAAMRRAAAASALAPAVSRRISMPPAGAAATMPGSWRSAAGAGTARPVPVDQAEGHRRAAAARRWRRCRWRPPRCASCPRGSRRRSSRR